MILRSGVWGPGCGLRLKVRELGFSVFWGNLGLQDYERLGA